jgi:hypothetical protein
MYFMIYETQAAEIIIQRSDIKFRQEANVSGGYNHLGVMIGSLRIATPSPSLTSSATAPLQGRLSLECAQLGQQTKVQGDHLDAMSC